MPQIKRNVVDGLREELKRQETELEKRRSELERERSSAIRECQQRLQTADELVEAKTRAEHAEGRLEAMRQTFSWKLTMPWRMLHRALTGSPLK